MLILTRRVGEKLIIIVDPKNPSKNIEVATLGIRGNQVRIGVDAPRDVAVHREEIYDRIKQEQSK